MNNTTTTKEGKMNELDLETTELTFIEKSKADQIKETFDPMVKMISGFEESYGELLLESKKEITKEVTKKAKRLRLDIAKVRVQTDKLRKSQKEEYLRAGKAIDGVSNILKWAISEKENKLSEIEKHFEILEQEKKEALQKKRVLEIESYVSDSDEKDYSSMEADVWAAYLQAKKKDYNDFIEAERKAEAERLEAEKKEALERERIKEENEKLKKEAAEREAKESIEREAREKIEAERLAKEAKEKAEREEKEKAEREAREKEALLLRKETEAKEKVLREEKELIEAELKAKEAEELRLKKEAESKIQSDLNKGDKDKVLDLIVDLMAIKTKYSFKSAKNKKTYSEVQKVIDQALFQIKEG